MIVFDESEYRDSLVPDDILLYVLDLYGPDAKDALLIGVDESARTVRMDRDELGEADDGFLLYHSGADSDR